MDRNKKEVLKHLETTHGRLANRITSLEKKTKDQISYLSNSMKENIAQVMNSNEYFIIFSGKFFITSDKENTFYYDIFTSGTC